MEKRTSNATRATPPKRNRKDDKPGFIPVDDASSPNSSSKGEFLVRSPKPKTTTHSSSTDMLKPSKQDVKSHPAINPSCGIATAPGLSILADIEHDSDGPLIDEIDVPGFLDTLRKAQMKRSGREHYIENFWFSCCVCDHPLNSTQTTCKCSHEICEDCYAKREFQTNDVRKSFKLDISSLATNDDANTGKIGSNEPESLLHRESQKAAVEHTLQYLWKALDQHEKLKRECSTELLRQVTEVHLTLAELVTSLRKEWTDSHKATTLKALCDLRDSIEATAVPFWLASLEIRFRFITFWARLHGRQHGRGPKLDQEACADAYRKSMEKDDTEELIETLQTISWMIGMAAKRVGTSEYAHILSLLRMQAETLERCNISTIEDGTSYYPTLMDNLLTTLQYIKSLVPPSVSIPHVNFDDNTTPTPSISLNWP